MDKGIIFSASMVRALLDGRKTQTRRLAKVRRDLTLGEMVERGERVTDGYRATRDMLAPPTYAPGDRLYVREACYIERAGDADGSGQLIIYRADTPDAPISRWSPSIHMPRWASRLTLLVTDVRVQRVAEISEADAIAEGIIEWAPSIDFAPPEYGYIEDPEAETWNNAVSAFYRLWNSLHTKLGETWADNPWVVAITFTVHHGNIDHLSRPPGDTNDARARGQSAGGEI